MGKDTAIVVPERVHSAILQVRGQRVMLASDLALLYGIDTKNLMKAVKRNILRFPDDFMFQLSQDELDYLRGRIGDSGIHGGRRYLPYAFTEQGVAMLSSVLRSPQAVRVNIEIMRAFVQLRKMMATHDDLRRKMLAMEKKYDGQFRVVFDAIREMMEPIEEPADEPAKKRIGFDAERGN